MADISDVENVLKTTITAILYPTGTSHPSITGDLFAVVRGWPTSDDLNNKLQSVPPVIIVSIYPQQVERRTTKYMPQDYVTNLPAATVTATVNVAASTITIGGTIATPQNVAVIANGVGVSHAVQTNDTPTSIATALATLLTGAGITASSSGPVVTISGVPTSQIFARIGTLATIVREIRRQKRNLMVTFWCPSPAVRDTAVPAIDAALAKIDYINLPDGTAGRILYEHSNQTDGLLKAALYRRDLVYSVEYGTTIVDTAPQILIQRGTMHGGNDPANPLIYQRDT